MSDITSKINDLVYGLDQLESSVRDLRYEAEAIRDNVEETSQGGDLISQLESAMSQLSYASESLPSEYTEVGQVQNSSDDVDRHIEQAREEIQDVLNALQQ